jgi:DMSO/TMAO reductase YedYZ heme-binding membrane subunit
MIALGLSYYVRDRIGQQRWKKLHRFTALAWLAGLAHSFGEGTDAGATWFVVATAIVVVPAFVLLIVRHLGPSSPQPVRQTKPARAAEAHPAAHGRAMRPTPPARHEIARQEIAR